MLKEVLCVYIKSIIKCHRDNAFPAPSKVIYFQMIVV